MNNGWTPIIPLKTRLENLLAQIPPEHQARAAAICVCENPYDFERNLTSYVLSKKWLLESGEQPHPAEIAYELEKAMDADGRNAVENEQIKAHFGNVAVTTSAEWRKRHLHQTEAEREEARQNSEMLRALRGGQG